MKSLHRCCTVIRPTFSVWPNIARTQKKLAELKNDIHRPILGLFCSRQTSGCSPNPNSLSPNHYKSPQQQGLNRNTNTQNGSPPSHHPTGSSDFNVAVADWLPNFLVYNPRRQLSRPSQDHRRRGARGDRCTTTVEFTQSPGIKSAQPYLHRVLPRPSPSSSAPDRRGEFTVSFSSSRELCYP